MSSSPGAQMGVASARQVPVVLRKNQNGKNSKTAPITPFRRTPL